MALTLLAANNAQTVLAAGINSTATALTVNTGTGNLFPTPVSGTSFFKLTLVDSATGSLTEIVHVTARTGDIMTIERGQEGTVSRAWSANDIAANMMTSGTLEYLAQKGKTLQIENNLSEIASSGSSATTAARSNLGLGSAALLSAITATQGASGSLIIPGIVSGVEKNTIIHWGSFAGSTSGDTPVTFPFPFPNAVRQIFVTGKCTGTGAFGGYNSETKSGFNGNWWQSSSQRQAGTVAYWAIGD
jgi:hypothetical protein